MAQTNHGTRNAIIILVALAIVGGGAYLLVQKLNTKPSVSKSDMVVEILSQSGGEGDYNTLMGLGNEYINAWYNAVKSKNSNFTVANKKFDTVTGKQIA